MNPTALALEAILLWGALPLWMAAGLADWACHRVQRIEETTGWKESLLHLLMAGQIGLGVLAALALHPTASLFALLLLCCIAHELTSWIDLGYANVKRRVPAYEQWVHAIQQCLPWAALTALAAAHPGQALAVVGLGTDAADWRLQWRDPALPPGGWAMVLSAATLFIVLPLANEAWRCAHTGRVRR